MNKMFRATALQVKAHECGAALFVSLVFLLILTIIGLTGMQNTSLQEKMASNMRDRSLAFQAAEAALRAGEDTIRNSATRPVFRCDIATDGLYDSSSQNPATDCPANNGWPSSSQKSKPYPVNDESFWTGNTDVVIYPPPKDNNEAFNNLAQQPMYIMEKLPPVKGQSLGAGSTATKAYYRVTAHGVGMSLNTVVVLQSVVRYK